jgi:hypothetical protein
LEPYLDVGHTQPLSAALYLLVKLNLAVEEGRTTHSHTHPPTCTGLYCASKTEILPRARNSSKTGDVTAGSFVRRIVRRENGGLGIRRVILLYGWLQTAGKINNKGPSGSGKHLYIYIYIVRR